MEVFASIDRLTILADMAGGKNQYQRFIDNPANTFVKGYNYTPTKFPYLHHWQLADGSYLEMSAPEAKVPDFRLDFNPNNVNLDDLAPVLSYFKFARVSRLDVAVDYSTDLSPYIWDDQLARKTCLFRSGSGRIETLYIGAARSLRRYRIYDKALEQKCKDPLQPWWRVEVQHRYGPQTVSWLPPGIFKEITIADPSSLDLHDAAMAEYIASHPEALGLLSKYARKKFKTSLKMASRQLTPHPSTVYEENRDRLSVVLQTYLDACASVDQTRMIEESIPF